MKITVSSGVVIVIVKNSQTLHCFNASTNGVVFSNFWVSFLVRRLRRHCCDRLASKLAVVLFTLRDCEGKNE